MNKELHKMTEDTGSSSDKIIQNIIWSQKKGIQNEAFHQGNISKEFVEMIVIKCLVILWNLDLTCLKSQREY